MQTALLGSSSGPTSEKRSRDHVIVSSGWWSCQAGRVEGGDSGTRDELGALHSALRGQAPPEKDGETPSLQPTHFNSKIQIFDQVENFNLP